MSHSLRSDDECRFRPGLSTEEALVGLRPPERRSLVERILGTIYVPSHWMVTRGEQTMDEQGERAKLPDTEKITINLGYVDLGHVDLLVREGFYANRTDFIRTAIRNQVNQHNSAIKRLLTRRSPDLGLRHYTRAELEAARDSGQPLDVRVLGLASIAADVTPELARAAIASIEVLGALQADPAVKAALRDRTR